MPLTKLFVELMWSSAVALVALKALRYKSGRFLAAEPRSVLVSAMVGVQVLRRLVDHSSLRGYDSSLRGYVIRRENGLKWEEGDNLVSPRAVL